MFIKKRYNVLESYVINNSNIGIFDRKIQV